jgi:hypothetical protein
MAIININTILGWFKAGKKPTEQQFTDTWHSFWHKDEVIPQATVEDLESDLSLKATQEDLEAHINDPNAHGGNTAPSLQQILDAGSTAVTSTTFNVTQVNEQGERVNLSLVDEKFTIGVANSSGGSAMTVNQNFNWNGSGTISMAGSAGAISLGNDQGVIQAGSGGTIGFDASNGVSISGNAGGIALNGSSQGITLNGQGGNISLDGYAEYNGVEIATLNNAGGTGLEKITENDNTGWRLKGVDQNNYGPIGHSAVDLSISENESDTKGATGAYSFASGYHNEASGDYSIATGQSNIVSGYSSFVTGSGTKADGAFSFASGQSNTVSGDFSCATGSGNTASGDFSFASGSGNTVSGNFSFVTGSGNKTDGGFSFASGQSNTVSGYFSSATGNSNIISGTYSFATGRNNKIASAYSFVTGQENTISETAYLSMVGGANNTVDGTYGFTTGMNNIVSKNSYSSIVGGSGNTISSLYNFTIGRGNNVNSNNSITFGENNIQTGIDSLLGGINSSSTQGRSITVGSTLDNNGYASALFGSDNTLNTAFAFAAGNNNTSNGHATFTTGYGNITNGDYSFAHGYSLTANTFAETIVGSFAKPITGAANISDPKDPAFRVGVGTSDTDRKDAIVVYKSGLIAAPESTVESIMSSDKKTLITKEYIDNAISSSGSIATLGTVLKTDSNATGISSDIVMQTSAQVKIDSGTSLTVGTSNASGNLYITSAVSRLQSNAGYVELASSANVNIVSNTNLINVTGNTYPTTTSAYDFGSSSLLWKSIWATAGNFSAINITTAPTANTTGTVWLTRNTSTGAIESTLPGYALTTGLSGNVSSVAPSSSSNIVTNISRIYGNLLTLRAYAAKTAAYSILSTDDTIDFTGTTTATATLLTAVGFTGKRFTIKNSGTGVITLATTSSQTIDGATTFTLPNQYSSITVQSDGANWKIMSVYGLQGEGTLSKSAAYTITAADYRYGQVTIFADASSAAFTITLEASAAMVGKTVNVIKTDSSANQVTIKGNGTTNINAANTQVLSSQYQAVKVKSNSTQYYLI